MMEILFRGLNYKGKMISGTSIINRKDWMTDVWVHRVFLLDGDACNYTPESSAFVEVKPNTVGRFTGMLDKNDVELYEGDIVKYPNVNCGKTLRAGPHVITWIKNGCVASLPGYLSLTAWIDDSCEIIGNIHENPELLEESA